MFLPLYGPHPYNTRQNVPLRQISHKTFTSKCIRYKLPEMLNSIPECITSKFTSHTLKSFGHYTKRFFCEQYNDSCTVNNCYICGQR